MSELWEIVRADQLKVGDVVHFGGDAVQMTIEYVRHGPTTILYRCVRQDSTFWEDNEKKVFRRIPDAEDPRVLRRALEMAVDYMSGNDKPAQMEVVYEFIDDARRELESKGR